MKILNNKFAFNKIEYIGYSMDETNSFKNFEVEIKDVISAIELDKVNKIIKCKLTRFVGFEPQGIFSIKIESSVVLFTDENQDDIKEIKKELIKNQYGPFGNLLLHMSNIAGNLCFGVGIPLIPPPTLQKVEIQE